ncbi:Ldh family oxidoreductase [Bosea sp. LjRoot9]|uniref:Ldh family oxidoreductase n=1 Tax=Bosea sp. LjRoot9 TaxID=3342341 RepID=UPI003ECD805C
MKHGFPIEDVVRCVGEILEARGCSQAVADVIARNCVAAERDGNISHGLFRLPGYLSNLDAGWTDGRAVPLIEEAASAFLRVNARNGFAQPALLAVSGPLRERARRHGIAVAAIRNSHHLASLSLDVEPFADAGFVAISCVNSMAVVVPHGARKAVFGTNPIAFAVPRDGAAPIVVDLATSAMAHGEVKIAKREGRTLPAGVGVDRAGEPTTDPDEVLSGGALVPFGGHKGSALAMMVELLCAALVGGHFSIEMELSKHPGAHTPNTGQTVILIDPRAGADPANRYELRVDELVQHLREAGQERLPGDRRLEARLRSQTQGLALTEEQIAMLAGFGGHLVGA